MSMVADETIPHRRPIMAILFIVLLSLALPVGIVWSTALLALIGKPLGMPAAEKQFYSAGIVKENELWYPAMKLLHGPRANLNNCRINRLNLTTGTIVDSGLSMVKESKGPTRGSVARPLWIGDELYLITKNSVDKCEGTLFKRVALISAQTGFLRCAPFAYDGQLTQVVETSNGGFRLVHLVDQNWVTGRRIILPGRGQVWDIDPQTGRKTLTTEAPTQSARKKPTLSEMTLTVMQGEQGTHLFLFDSTYIQDRPYLSAYRNGFEFADQDSDTAAAPASESPGKEAPNSENEVSPKEVAQQQGPVASGWEPIQPADDFETASEMTLDRYGAVFLLYPPMRIHSQAGLGYRIVRRNHDGSWIKLADLEPLPIRYSTYRLISQPNGTAYVAQTTNIWNSGIFSRIDATAIHPEKLTLPSDEPQYVARWKWPLVGLAAAWLAHILVLVVGCDFCRRHQRRFEFGNEQVFLASTWQRFAATLIDLAVFVSILSLAWYGHSSVMRLEWEYDQETQFSAALYEIESVFAQMGIPGLAMIPYFLFKIGSLARPKDLEIFFTLVASVVADTGLVLWCYKSYREGRYGTTPGKSLLGIRSVQTTLRPCGFGRALARDLLYGIDVPLLLSPLPAIISMMLSPCNQRIGDRVADTIVIRTNSGGLKEEIL